MHEAFAESTRSSYSTLFRTFIAFLTLINVQPQFTSPTHILAFLEFLVFNKVSHSQISNYLAFIYHFALDTSPFFDQKIKLFTKAVARQAPLTVKLKAIIDIPILIKIIQECEHLYMGFVFKAEFLLAYFAFS